MSWLHPEWRIPAATALAVAAALLAWAALRAGRRRRALLGAGPALAGGARDLVLWAALAALVAAALGPRLGTREDATEAQGVDLVLLLDVSRSMDARDVAPSRLERARRNAEEVLARLGPADRAALAAFAGTGVLLTPLTPDHDALLALVPSLDSELMPAGGSRLGEGVRAALGAFEESSRRPGVLLVLSDGEDPATPSGDDGAADAVRAGVRVLAAAVGGDEGATVPDHGIPLRDADGHVVRTTRDTARLATLADATGGALLPTDAFGAVDAGATVAAARRDVSPAPGQVATRRVPAERGTELAALALALLAFEAAGRWRRRGVPAARRAHGAHAVATGAVLGFPVAAGAVLPLAGAMGAVLPLAGAMGATLALALGGVVPARADAPGDTSAQRLLRALAEEAARSEREHAAPQDAGASGADVVAGDPADLANAVAVHEARLAATGGGDARALLRLGIARARAGHAPAAERAFLAAALHARDPADAALAFHDLGVMALERDDLEAARDAFLDALVFAPDDLETRFNLEWTLRALREQPPAAAPEAGGRREGTAPRPDTDEDRAGEAAAQPRSGEGASRPEPGATGEGDAALEDAASGAAPALDVPRLGAHELERWLDAVDDEPGRALRDAARRQAEGARPAPGAPGW